MASESEVEALRTLAPRWSLAGDEQLLNILQNTHKNIITKCQEVNSKLDHMNAALDDASISLQNVNNKFLALSNSQFIESRVYDDDADVSTEITPVKETPQKPASQELDVQALRNGLSVLQKYHETVTILKDSDSETDSDGEDGDRVVLKPKDLYSDRPLPYIIGSQAWKNSWHAGLIPEDSDTESGSAGREPQSPQYSDSEPEDTQLVSKANATISESNSEVSEQESSLPPPKTTPADIAADLAKRLGGQQPKIVESEPEYSPPKAASRTVYKPHQPQTGTIFTDEPPPLDSQSDSSDEDDIFAELHNKNKERVVEDLFAGRVYGDVGKVVPQPRIEQRPLFEDDPDDLEDRQPVKRIEEEKTASKKPVGGISVFGTNKGAESIGAAILKRNQHQSTSEEETDSEDHKPPPKPKTIDQTDSTKTEKDIFDDLFAKSANLEKKKQTEENKKEVKSVPKHKVDLFSDNLFDDVGDIFTTNVMKNKSNQKSIFDDDDELFADIAPVTKKVDNKSNEVKGKDKSIFDSDDELFAEKSTTLPKSSKESPEINRNEQKVSNKDKIETPNPVINIDKSPKNLIDDTKSVNNKSNVKSTMITKSIFDSDSDSDIFSHLVMTKDTGRKPEKNIFDPKEKVFTEDASKNTSEVKKDVIQIGDDIKNLRSPSIFDDDDDELFADTSKDRPKDSHTTPKDAQNTNILRENPEEVSNIEKAGNSVLRTEIPVIDDAKKITDIAIAVDCKQTVVPVSEDNNVFERKESNISLEPSISCSIDHEEHLFKNQANDQLPTISDNQNENIFETQKSHSKKLVAEAKTPSVQENQNVLHYEIESELERDKAMDDIDNNYHINQQVPGIDDDFIEKDTLFQNQKSLIPKDIFDDEPPVFEKPKEPKRSKNVNALFDDDSEDEALFFRKSDIEDKSENIPSTVQSDRLFGIFHDEPPAIDDFRTDGDTDMFTPVSEPGITKNKVTDIFKEKSKIIDDFKDTTSVESVNDVSEKNENNTSISKKGNVFPASDIEYFDDLFKTMKPGPETLGSENKPINIHDTFREIKEDEFDDIFKAANKVIDTSNDDIFKLSVDEFIKSTENDHNQIEKLSESIPDATDVSRPAKLPEKAVESIKSEINFDSDEELFRTLPKPEKPTVPDVTLSDELDEGALIIKDKINISKELEDKSIFKAINVVESKKESEKEQLKNDSLDDLDQKPELRRNEAENQSKNNDIKKIGRVKSLNLNIDVSTLLPGASPKKQKIDTPKVDPKSDPTLEEISKQVTPEIESKMLKSITFEGEPNSDILDNKLSKERARIQVKRRPSTRKARREAVRKSAIDFDDSTDNSSSIDDPPKSVESKSPSKIDKTVTNNSSSNILNSKDSTIDNNEIYSKVPPDVPKNEAIIDKVPEKPKVTSKVVYILNDEDIFDTKPVVKESELFKKEPVPTLGSVYQQSTKADKTLDEKIAKKASKVSIFDSDSDEELFGGKGKSKKKVETKSSLFGDDEDENLFGVKHKKADSTSKPQATKSASKDIERSSEPVFNDPLSMLRDD